MSQIMAGKKDDLADINTDKEETYKLFRQNMLRKYPESHKSDDISVLKSLLKETYSHFLYFLVESIILKRDAQVNSKRPAIVHLRSEAKYI